MPPGWAILSSRTAPSIKQHAPAGRRRPPWLPGSNGEVIAVARVKCHRAAVALGENAEAVVLDFVNPARRGWQPLGGAGQTGFEALQLALQNHPTRT